MRNPGTSSRSQVDITREANLMGFAERSDRFAGEKIKAGQTRSSLTITPGAVRLCGPK